MHLCILSTTTSFQLAALEFEIEAILDQFDGVNAVQALAVGRLGGFLMK